MGIIAEIQKFKGVRKLQQRAVQAAGSKPSSVFDELVAPSIPGHLKMFREAGDTGQFTQLSDAWKSQALEQVASVPRVPMKPEENHKILADILSSAMLAGMMDATLVTLSGILPAFQGLPGHPELQELFNRPLTEFKENLLPQGKEALEASARTGRAGVDLFASANDLIVPMVKAGLTASDGDALEKYSANLLRCAVGAYSFALSETAARVLQGNQAA